MDVITRAREFGGYETGLVDIEPVTLFGPVEREPMYLFINDRGQSMWRTADAGKDLREPWRQAFTLRP